MVRETVHPRQHREQQRPQAGDGERGGAAQQDRTHQAEPAGGDARFEFAQLVGGADEHGIDRADAPADVVRRFVLHQKVADVDAHHVARAEEEQGAQGHREAAGEAHRQRGQAEHGDTAEHPQADAARNREEGQRDRAQGRPQSRGAAQPAEGGRAGMQHVVGIGGQQRGGAAEQHREQVERDRAQHDRARPHEAQAFHQRMPAHRPLAARLSGRAGARHAQHRDAQEAGRDHVHGHRAEGVQQAADDRAGDHGHMEGRGAQGHGLAEVPVGHQVLQHRLRGRHHEGARGAEQHQDREHRPDDGAAARREAHQEQAAQQLRGHAQQDDVAAVVAVGPGAGPQAQPPEGRELRQADQAQVEQAAGDLVDLPADGDALHLHREGAEEAAGKVEGEVTVAQDGQAAGRGQQGHEGLSGQCLGSLTLHCAPNMPLP